MPSLDAFLTGNVAHHFTIDAKLVITKPSREKKIIDIKPMQLAYRIRVTENAAMAELCRRQVPVYNDALRVFRHDYFGWEYLGHERGQEIDPERVATWRAYYTEPKVFKKNPDAGRVPGKRATRTENVRWHHANGTYVLPSRKKEGGKPLTWMFNNSDVRDVIRDKMMRWLPEYRAAGSCAENTVDRAGYMVDGYWAHLAEWIADGANDTGKPRFPNYIRGENAKTVAIFRDGQFSIKDSCLVISPGLLRNAGIPPIDPIPINGDTLPDQELRGNNVGQVRIVPCQHGGYWVECVYRFDVPGGKDYWRIGNVDSNGKWTVTAAGKDAVTKITSGYRPRVLSIDLGLNRLATMTDNIGGQPWAISGGPVKTINQYYNRKLAHLRADQARCSPRLAGLQRKKSAIAERKKAGESVPRSEMLTDAEWKEWRELTAMTPAMKKITDARNNKIAAYRHRASRLVANDLIERDFDVVVIGHNKNQKQRIDIGKRNNQNFVQIPIFKFAGDVAYKSAKAGKEVIDLTEEFTSKASYLDGDMIPDRKKTKKKANGHSDVQFSGSRLKRGMYRSSNGTLIQADVNGSYNIGRKAFPEACACNAEEIEGARLHPVIRRAPPSDARCSSQESPR